MAAEASVAGAFLSGTCNGGAVAAKLLLLEHWLSERYWMERARMELRMLSFGCWGVR